MITNTISLKKWSLLTNDSKVFRSILLGVFVTFCSLEGIASATNTQDKGNFFQSYYELIQSSVENAVGSEAFASSMMMGPCPNEIDVIGGEVFLDYNYDGSNNEIDNAFPDISVYIYDCNGVEVANTVTDADGQYFFDNLVTGDEYRIDFIIPEGLYSTKSGSDNLTTVQFVNAPSCTTSVGVANPAEYCSTETPSVVVPCFVNGDPLAAGNTVADDRVLVKVSYDNTAAGVETLATFGELGSVNGIAYQRSTERIFAAAFLKRHIGLGNLGLDGIYVYDTATDSVIEWLNVSDLGVGIAPFSSNAARGLPLDAGLPSYDPTAFDSLGVVGFGDIEMDENDERLWFVSISDNKLYSLDIDSDGDFSTAPTAADLNGYTIPDPGCANGTFRPFGLKYWRGNAYVGGICDAMNGTIDDLTATIFKLQANGNFEEILSFDLDYNRGNIWENATCTANTDSKWEPWSNDFPAGCNGNFIVAPSPMLTDIEFTPSGELIIGFSDRMSHQIGWNNYDKSGVNTDLYNNFSGGDILKATLNNGVYTLEANGNGSAGAGNGEGPMGGEFFYQDFFNGTAGTTDPAPHNETAQGALALLPGSGEVLTTAFDPFMTTFNSGGINWMNYLDGSVKAPGKRIFATTNPNQGTFGKAVGLGDLELLCGNAPLQIGNRVWIDANKNGIQDPCELPIEGLNVNLFELNGAPVATAITDTKGEYYFSSDDPTNQGAIEPYTNYYAVFGMGQYNVGTEMLFDTLSLTDGFVGIGPTPHINDSNGVIADNSQANGMFLGMPLMLVELLAPGEFDHSYDIGFRPQDQPSDIGDFVWKDCNDNGIQDQGELGLPDVYASLYSMANGVPTFVEKDTTDALGKYLFEDQPAGMYVIEFELSVGYSGLTIVDANQGFSEALDSNVDPMTGRTAPFITVVDLDELTIDAGYKDIEAPTLISYIVLDTTISCGDNFPIVEPIFTDNCDEDVTVSIVENDLTGDCSAGLERIITATDDCGNETVITQTFSRLDDIAPVISGIPNDTTYVSCDFFPSVPTITTMDNCGTVTTTIDTTITTGNCAGSSIIAFNITATDECLNETTATQTITILPDSPSITAPDDVTVECDPDLVDNEPILDNGCTNITITDEVDTPTPGSCPFDYTIERTWTAIADCGETFEVSQTITVIDTTAPVLTLIHPDLQGVEHGDTLYMECDAGLFLDVNDVTAIDNCGEASVQFIEYGGVNGTCAEDGFLASMHCGWVATDLCQNQDSIVLTIFVVDNTPPVFVDFPDDITGLCGEDIEVPHPATVNAIDNCLSIYDLTFSADTVEMACANSYMITRTWSATDVCGNTNTQSQTISVGDDGAPILSDYPEDIVLNCQTTFPTAPMITASDLCEGVIDVVFEENIMGTACEGAMITRTWTAQDACGNVTTHEQMVIIQSNWAPVFEDVPSDITLSCNAAIPANEVTVTDDCQADLPIEFTEIIDGNECDGGTIIRTWTATDQCGLTANATQTITLLPNEMPTLLDSPADITIDCGETVSTGMAMFEDDCADDLEVQFTEELVGNPCTNHQIVRQWTATDACGLVATATQTIFVSNNASDFAFTNLPADITVSCDEIPAPASVEVSEGCNGTATIDYEETTNGSNCDDLSYVRTWTATNDCGQSITYTQIITTIDNEAPMALAQPADVTVACDAIPDPAQVAFMDDCDTDVAIDYTQLVTGDDCDNRTLVRMWTGMDDCGNTAQVIQTITLIDDEAPILNNVPADLTVSCAANANTNMVTATDNCDDAPLVEMTETTTGSGCEYELIRTWTATDACGLTSSASQTITVIDDEAPVFVSIPSAITISCDEALPNADNVTATDNCDDTVEVVVESSTSGGNSICNQLVLFTFTAIDDCGNTTTATQLITIIDNEAPVFAAIDSTTTAECNNIPLPITPNVTDNCDIDPTVLFEENATSGTCINGAYIIERTWIATDECGNMATLTQIVNVIDNEAPTLQNVPTSLTLNCDETPTLTTVTATDNCTASIDVSLEETTSTIGCETTIERTWTATDDCGNIATATQNILIIDTEAPILQNVPDDIAIDCTEMPSPAMVTATDNCTTGIIVSFEETNSAIGCEITITRTWTATDDCGNTSTASQDIVITDNEVPTFINAPIDMNLSCDATIPAPMAPTFEDDCDSDLTIDFEETTSNEVCTHTYLLTRTWIATDDCGNTATHTQTITIADTEAPVLVNIPQDITIECGAPLPTQDDYLAVDNCDDNPTVEINQTIAANGCIEAGIYTTSITVTDICGNTNTYTQTITIVDTVAPMISFTDPDLIGLMDGDTITVNCSNIPALNNSVVAVDACDESPMVIFSETIDFSDDCMADGYFGLMTCMWQATDACGNAASVTITIIIQDMDAPVVNCPADITIDLNNGETLPTLPANVSAMDLCDNDVSADFEGELVINPNDSCVYTIERTWSSMDNCGNIGTCTQVITVLEGSCCTEIVAQDTIIMNAVCDTLGSIALDIENPADYNYIWVPNFGTPSTADNARTDLPANEYLITVYADGEEDCPTKFYLTVGSEACDTLCTTEVFEEDSLTLTESMDSIYCLEINPYDALHYLVEINGDAYTAPLMACGMDTVVYYGYSMLYNQGDNPPYIVENWTYPLGFWSGTVNSIQQLVDTMNTIDPDGNWVNDTTLKTIAGPSNTAGYGDLIISHPVSNSLSNLQVNATIVATGTEYLIPNLGENTIVFIDPDGCVDSLIVTIEADEMIQEEVPSLLQSDIMRVQADDCFSNRTICLSDDAALALEYEVRVNDEVAILQVCDFVETMRYSIFSIPGNGENGPYLLDNWTVNGESYSGTFNSKEELVTLMNNWDTSVTWSISALGQNLEGGSSSNDYSNLQISQSNTGIIAYIEPSFTTEATGIALHLPVGVHQVVSEHLASGVLDSMEVTVGCPTETEHIQVQVMEQAYKEQCLDISELAGEITGCTNICLDNSGEYATIEENGLETCLLFHGVEPGIEEACIVICDDNSICDTTYVQINVMQLADEQDLPNNPKQTVEQIASLDEISTANPTVTVTNGFSPNGDGVNDALYIDGLAQFPNHELRIYNRWGSRVMTATNYQNDWQGTWGNKDLQTGTYFYIIDLGNGEVAKGFLQIQR